MDRDKLLPYAGREQASVKHFLLQEYLKRLIMITGLKRHDRIAYVDAFAGPWQATRDDLGDTSFAKAVDVMADCREHLARLYNRSVSFRALFAERDPDRYALLKQFAKQRSTEHIQIEAKKVDFTESASEIADWIRDDEMAFVLVDPTGWKDVIAPKTLRPLLIRPNVELLINVMWNFINMAYGHTSQEQNLRDLVGDEYSRLSKEGGVGAGQKWMQAYVKHLRHAAPVIGSGRRLRTAWFPVEFATRDRVFYYLAYVTHHVKGIIVFLEESERAEVHQQRAKSVAKQKLREVRSRIPDIFDDDEIQLPRKEVDHVRSRELRRIWLELLRAPGSEVRVDEERIADMAETCGCFIFELQESLRSLIADGMLQNLDVRKLRPKNVVDYRKGERILRLK